MTEPTSAFALTDPAKADARLLARDEEQFAAIAAALRRRIAETDARLASARSVASVAGGSAQDLVERDAEVRRLGARLRLLRRFGIDLCLGRMVPVGGEPVYIGRIGLTDDDGGRLLVDWRAPAAEPFFAATHGHPLGLATRRRYRWTRGRVSDFWDEVFTLGTDGDLAPLGSDGLGHAEPAAALDDQSAFIASLGDSRSGRMRDVLATIQADQDAVIRADAHGPLVVDGGPGTGKTVVALHRAAFLLYSDPRLSAGRGGVLFVGPTRGYLDYVDDVLPGLGEEGVLTCTVRDLVPEGAAAVPEADRRVAELKGRVEMVRAIEPAVAFYEEPPEAAVVVETPWADVVLDPDDWADAFAAPDPGTPHNEARTQVWDALAEIVAARLADEEADAAPRQVRQALAQNEELVRVFTRAWPVLDPSRVVADLWAVPAYLRRCAPWLDAGEAELLRRPRSGRDAEPVWTTADLPLLDAVRERVGDASASARERRRQAAIAARRAAMASVVDDLIAADDSEMLVMSMLRGADAQNSLVDDDALPSDGPDLDPGSASRRGGGWPELAGPFAHIVVDEAQELTDAEWGMLLRRCPSRSLTIVGDRAQARHGFRQTWQERLGRVGLRDVTLASLTINYRTPAEVMAEAEPVIRRVFPEANVPVSVRAGGPPVRRGSVAELGGVLASWLAGHDGIVAVIAADPAEYAAGGMNVEAVVRAAGDTAVRGAGQPAERAVERRVRVLTPEAAKGLEFDLVVLVDPAGFGEGVEGAVDRYVAMTRATQQLVLLEGRAPGASATAASEA